MPKQKASHGGVQDDWKASGSFIRRPAQGWLHDNSSLSSGIAYNVKYVGCVKILRSMRTIPNPERGDVCRDAIMKCCDDGGLIPLKKKPHSHNGILGESYTSYCGEPVELNISKKRILIKSIASGMDICVHDVTSISFASAGDKGYSSMVAYVSKDVSFERACFVLECDKKVAQQVIQTIGQAFEIKFKEFLNTPMTVTEVPERFVNPIFPTGDNEETASTTYASLNNDDTSTSAYASHYSVPKGTNTLEAQGGAQGENSGAADGYSKLQRLSQPSQIQIMPGYQRLGQTNFEEDQSNVDVMFTAGDHYSDPDAGFAEYAAVYDNPIASPSARTESSAPVIYDNPVNLMDDFPPNPAQTNGVQNWTTFEDDGGQKKEYKDPQGYLVPANGQRKQMEEDDDEDDDASEYQPVPTKDDYQRANPLARESWFHGNIKRDDAEALIHSDGDFLVRESSSSKGQYVLSGMQDGQCRHLLLVDPEGKVRTKDRQFKDVPELISYHLKNNVPIISGGSSVFLKQEVNKGGSQDRSSFMI